MAKSWLSSESASPFFVRFIAARHDHYCRPAGRWISSLAYSRLWCQEFELPGPAEIDKLTSAFFKVSPKREDVYFLE